MCVEEVRLLIFLSNSLTVDLEEAFPALTLPYVNLKAIKCFL